MTTYRITPLARSVGLSRATLLHYDRIGLLSPSDRTPSGYRIYTDPDRRRLERICQYRSAGLPLSDIRALLHAPGKPTARVLEKRLRSTTEEIGALRAQQHLLAGMLRRVTGHGRPTPVDKPMWIAMLRAAGVSPSAMERWHIEFERRSPQGHHDFLASLGLSPAEIARIRAHHAPRASKNNGPRNRFPAR